MTQPDDGSATPSYGTPPTYGTPPYGEVGYGEAPAPYGGAELASWGRRVGGYLLDVLIVGIPLGVVLSLLSDGGTTQRFTELLGAVVLGVLNGARGQTPGKSIVKIKLLRERDGQVLGAGLGVVRQFLHILDALPLLLGFLWPIWDKKKQTFADKIVGTVVIRV